jgi:hypothetical protein
MTRTLLLALVLAAFTAYTGYAVAVHGYVGFFEALMSSAAGIQVLLDLVIALTLVLVWMAGDAQQRGLPFWRYAAVCVFLGSIGPLAYLIHRELRARTLQGAPA